VTAGNLTPEERLTRVEEHRLVTAEMMSRNEQKWDERLTRLADIMDRIELRQNQQDLALMEVKKSLALLIETVEKFIHGRGGNGNRPAEP
jgi:hypothetical protein